MAQKKKSTSHEQLPLIEQTWPLVTLELLVHFDGPSGLVVVGSGVKETGGSATMSIDVASAVPLDQWHSKALSMLAEASNVVWANLAPF